MSETKPRWAIIANALCIGSTSATELCRANGLDPDYELAAFGEQPSTDQHTGWSASWCDICGDCTCPKGEDGEPEVDYHASSIDVVHDDNCPLHGTNSEHCG